MQNKWYIYVIIVALALLGGTLEQKETPNQEIVFQYAEKQNEHSLAQTIDTLKDQLAQMGIKKVEVNTLADGTVSISYYSTFDAQFIKSQLALSKANMLAHHSTNESSLPEEKAPVYIQFDVHSIQEATPFQSSLDGVSIIFEWKINRHTLPDFFTYKGTALLASVSIQTQEAVVPFEPNAFYFQNASYTFPEVRAGPWS